MDLAKGEARHKEAILKVREEARVELDLERQKQQELITKYQREHEELQQKVCNAQENTCGRRSHKTVKNGNVKE